MGTFKKISIPVAATFLILTSSQAISNEAYNLRFVSFVGQNTSIGEASDWWMDEVEARSGGRIKFNRFYGASLIPPSEIFPAIQDGRIHVGWGVHSYSGNPFPLTKVSEIPFQTRNPLAVTYALNSLYKVNEEFQKEWESRNLYPLAFVGSPPNVVGSTKEISSLSDFEGKRLRSLDYVAFAQREAGANVVALPATDIYESLQRGLIDGYSAFRLDLVGSMRLTEQAQFLVDDGSGVYGNSELVVNHALWNNLPEDLKAVVYDVNSELPSVISDIYSRFDSVACDIVKETDAVLKIMPDSFVLDYRDLVENKIIEDWISKTGVSDVAEDFLTEYNRLIMEGELVYSGYEPGMDRCINS